MFLYVRGPRNEVHMNQVLPTVYKHGYANGMPVLIDSDEMLVRLWRVVAMLGGEGASIDLVRTHRNLQDKMRLNVAKELKVIFGMSGNYHHVMGCSMAGLGDSAIEALVDWARNLKKNGVDYPHGWEY